MRFHTSDLKCKATFNNYVDRYVWGMIWAATLWDLRKRVGPEVVDVLALEALRRHSLVGGFVEATKDMVDAEWELFGGEFKTDLYEVFRARGFVLPRANPVDETPMTTPLTIQVWPNPATDLLQISFESFLGGNLILFDVWGREVLRQRIEPGTNSVTVSVSNLSPGPYVAAVRIGAHTQQFVITVFR
ncbi:T9SS type A sorting domain-containing protein [bacterium]|nr:T9SS type A sorting domain-containing protein [bacterium]